jgi:hypothetical protein
MYNQPHEAAEPQQDAAMTLFSDLTARGLREFKEVSLDSPFYSFERVKEALNGNVQILPSIRIPITVCVEIDAQPQTCTLVVPAGKLDVIRRCPGNIENGAVKIGPFYLEVEAHHPV